MRSRLLAGAILIASGLIAWLAISAWPAARLLQGAIGLSLLYVAYLAWRGWRVMRDARSEPSAPPSERPWVTVLVPAADESTVIATVVADLIAQDYAAGGERRFDVLVLDDGGNWKGCGTAWKLAEDRHEVTLVTPDALVGKELQRMAVDAPLRRALVRLGVRFMTESAVVNWDGKRARIESLLGGPDQE